MERIYHGIPELIGNTPLVEVKHFSEDEHLEARLLLKLEYFNPAGSVKDRIAKSMIEEAEKEGKLKKGSVLIEPTSGNTGIGLAALAAAKGLRIGQAPVPLYRCRYPRRSKLRTLPDGFRHLKYIVLDISAEKERGKHT